MLCNYEKAEGGGGELKTKSAEEKLTLVERSPRDATRASTSKQQQKKHPVL